MNLLLILSSVCGVGQSTLTKLAATKNTTGGIMHFNALQLGASLVFFVFMALGGFRLHLPTVGFAFIYGVAMFFCNIFGYMALMTGSMALSSLLVSYYVVIPCFFGIAFLGERLSSPQVIGLLILGVSMFLLIRRDGDKKTSGKWLFYVAMTFLTNGICSVVQKLHQTFYPSSFCNEFMLFSTVVILLLFCGAFVLKKEKGSLTTAKFAIPAGIFAGLSTYLTLVLSATVDAAVLFPVTYILSMVLKLLVSRLLFRDKFSILQLFGIGLGVISVLLVVP